MSTDMQRYSLQNQSEAIALYAARRGLAIVRSYEDAGKSGLRLDRRNALKALLDDVKSGRADFDVILVYDVSRWGRFQDADESAYYEFTCKGAGVAVEYCAEQFENDGSLTATVVKNIKRAMAGEYSRELSVKTFAGQSRIAAKGFHVGATPGYGLRRFLVDEHGNRRMELPDGQWKSIHSDRVILVPGPPHEIETIKGVYHAFIEERRSLNDIARSLNRQGVPNVTGRAWSSIAIRQLLANEKYLGTSVYNRTSKKLGAKWRRNPSDEWVRGTGAFEAIVSPEQFHAARQQLKENASRYTEPELLDILAAIWCRAGVLTRDVIQAWKGAPSTNTYRKHFGSLANAYQALGYKRRYIANRTTNLILRKTICKNIAACVGELGGTVRMFPACQLSINEEFTVSVVVGRSCRSAGPNQWRFGYRSRSKPDILIVARVDAGEISVKDYFVLPFLFLPRGSWLTVSGVNYQRLESFRSTTLEPFFALCARERLEGLHT